MNDLGRYGIWVPRRVWPAEPNTIASAAQELESLGFGAVWIGGSPPDDLARFVDSALVWGDDEAVRDGVRARLEACADAVAVQVHSADPAPRLPRDEWRRPAAILL